MFKSVILGIIALVLLMALAITGCGPSAPTGVIKVGVVTSYSGPPGIYGQAATNGFEMAANEINAAGGVLNRTIEFTTRDDKFDPATGLTGAKELIMAEMLEKIPFY